MGTKGEESHCPLCTSDNIETFFEDKKRAYLRCLFCKLVFVPRQFWLNADEEKAIYDLHENDVHNQGYRQFLSRMSMPLLERLEPKQRGLDFGCGPGPALSHMFAEQGHRMDLYDPFYFNDSSVFQNQYDFISATEVVEHLHDPNKEFATLFRLLRRGGWLAIMTKLVTDEHAFRTWHYIRDMTHICFYSRSTFNYVGLRFGATLTFVADDVMLFQKT